MLELEAQGLRDFLTQPLPLDSSTDLGLWLGGFPFHPHHGPREPCWAPRAETQSGVRLGRPCPSPPVPREEEAALKRMHSSARLSGSSFLLEFHPPKQAPQEGEGLPPAAGRCPHGRAPMPSPDRCPQRSTSLRPCQPHTCHRFPPGWPRHRAASQGVSKEPEARRGRGGGTR